TAEPQRASSETPMRVTTQPSASQRAPLATTHMKSGDQHSGTVEPLLLKTSEERTRDELLEGLDICGTDAGRRLPAAVRADGTRDARRGARAGACGKGTHGRTVPVQLPREDDELSRGAPAIRARWSVPETREPDDRQRLRVR